ncbi:hypothetical protein NLJ89_g5231 [Agrocybe chaxingu]|uniref:Bud22 domain-containing protein n=1 Tax=Agrocybe chaxingu TaxID=84603 RepID=A0A9W8JYY3_9AGAR|nr:hypothetical protein NLJ89_g5231 [Agrocybe chaxingu]
MEIVKVGVKRKRYEPRQEERSVRVAGKIHHEKKEVHRASKRAKVFETQKVVKRLKDLRKKNEDSKGIEALEGELDSLKGIDHDAVGNSAFRSKVHKDHTLRDDEHIKAAIAKELENNLCAPAEPGTTLSKIQSRLLSSKILAIQVASSVESLKVLLNPALKRHKPDDLTHSISSPLERPSKAQNDAHSNGNLMQAKPKSEPENDELSDGPDEGGWESGSIEETGSDNGWESGSIDGNVPDDRKQSTSSEDEAASDQESESDFSVGAAKDKQIAKSKPQKTSASAAKSGKTTSTAESTFLPSLSVGFIRGSDDSDWSETEGKAADMPKKNRRGQRARRAIWEKKFGRSANHKKKEAEERALALSRKNKGHTSVVNTGSNAIHSTRTHSGHGAPGSTGPNTKTKNTPQRQQPVDGGWGTRSTNAMTSQKPLGVKDDSKPLHPSWEAKRKLKEKESVGIVPSQGRKIKFS